jgi:hypothetical protein
MHRREPMPAREFQQEDECPYVLCSPKALRLSTGLTVRFSDFVTNRHGQRGQDPSSETSENALPECERSRT